MKKQMIDQQTRVDAAVQLDKNAVVIAGAGTGKTRLLVDRATFILLNPKQDFPGNMNRFVAITFTEKAAAELKERIFVRMLRIISTIDGIGSYNDKLESSEHWVYDYLIKEYKFSKEELRTRAEMVLTNLDKAVVGTIHSFAAHILRLAPLTAGVDPEFEVDEGVKFDQVFTREWSRWLETELCENATNGNAWKTVLRVVSIESVKTFVRHLSEFGTNLAVVRKASEVTLDIKKYKNIADVLYEKYYTAKIEKRSEQRFVKNDDTIRVIKSLMDNYPDTKISSLSSDDIRCFNYKLTTTGGWTIEDIAEANSLRIFLTSDIVTSTLKLILPFIEIFRREYLREGAVSFDGILSLCRDMLRSNHSIREEFKHEFSAFLVDEFQDTEPSQGEIILYLCEHPGRCAESISILNLVPGKLFIVGDPKQSIYRFRGADITTFERIRSLLISGGAVEYTLKTNFRSNNRIIDAVNSLFENIMPSYEPIHCHPDNTAALPHQTVEFISPQKTGVEPGEDKELNASDACVGEAFYIADWIIKNVGKLEITDTKTGVRKLRYNDIAILMRTGSKFDIYKDALKQEDIPYTVEGERSFYDVPEIHTMTNLLRCIADPGDTIALTGVLHSPVGGLNEKDIYILSKSSLLDYRQDVPVLIEKHKSINSVYAVLRELHVLSSTLGVYEIVNRTVELMGIDIIYATDYHGEQRVANINKFKIMALELGDLQGLTFNEFIDEVEEKLESSEPESEHALTDEMSDMVRMMTIHKAKGLEFNIVFLPNLHGGIQGNNRDAGPNDSMLTDWSSGKTGFGLGRFLTMEMAELKTTEKSILQAETVRVLYVAMTRARQKLVLLGNRTKKPVAGAFLKLYHPGNETQAPILEEKKLVTLVPYKFTAGITETTVDKKRVEAGVEFIPAEIVEAIKHRRKRLETIKNCPSFASATALRKKNGEDNDNRESYYDTAVTRYKHSDTSRVVGIIAHGVLESCKFDTIPGFEWINDAVTREIKVLEPLYPILDWREVRGEAVKVVSSFFNSPAMQVLLTCKIAAQEAVFMYSQDGQTFRGAMDLVYYNPSGGLVIADYKSDFIPEGVTPEKYAQKYKIQSSIYREALARCIPGIKIADIKFHLIFLRTGTVVPI
ncbi:MAG: UvrD-helicase domain-containing protein [Elusimicrobiota bacterium]